MLVPYPAQTLRPAMPRRTSTPISTVRQASTQVPGVNTQRMGKKLTLRVIQTRRDGQFCIKSNTVIHSSDWGEKRNSDISNNKKIIMKMQAKTVNPWASVAFIKDPTSGHVAKNI